MLELQVIQQDDGTAPAAYANSNITNTQTHTHVGNVETSEHWRNSSVCAGMCTACALNDYITVTYVLHI